MNNIISIKYKFQHEIQPKLLNTTFCDGELYHSINIPTLTTPAYFSKQNCKTCGRILVLTERLTATTRVRILWIWPKSDMLIFYGLCSVIFSGGNFGWFFKQNFRNFSLVLWIFGKLYFGNFFFVSFSFIYIYLQFNGGLGYFPGWSGKN